MPWQPFPGHRGRLSRLLRRGAPWYGLAAAVAILPWPIRQAAGDGTTAWVSCRGALENRVLAPPGCAGPSVGFLSAIVLLTLTGLAMSISSRRRRGGRPPSTAWAAAVCLGLVLLLTTSVFALVSHSWMYDLAEQIPGPFGWIDLPQGNAGAIIVLGGASALHLTFGLLGLLTSDQRTETASGKAGSTIVLACVALACVASIAGIVVGISEYAANPVTDNWVARFNLGARAGGPLLMLSGGLVMVGALLRWSAGRQVSKDNVSAVSS